MSGRSPLTRLVRRQTPTAKGESRPSRQRSTGTLLCLSLLFLVVLLVAAIRFLQPAAPGSRLTLDEVTRYARCGSLRADPTYQGLSDANLGKVSAAAFCQSAKESILSARLLDEDSRLVGTIAPVVTPAGLAATSPPAMARPSEFWVSYPKSDAVTSDLLKSAFTGGVQVTVDPQPAKRMVRFTTQFVLPMLLLANVLALFFYLIKGKGSGRRSSSPSDKAGDGDVSPPTLEHLEAKVETRIMSGRSPLTRLVRRQPTTEKGEGRPSWRRSAGTLLCLSLLFLVVLLVAAIRFLQPAAPGSRLTLDAVTRYAKCGSLRADPTYQGLSDFQKASFVAFCEGAKENIFSARFLDEDSRLVGTIAPVVTPAGPAATSPPAMARPSEFWVSYPKSDAVTNDLLEKFLLSGVQVSVDAQPAKRMVRFTTQFVLPMLLLANVSGLFFYLIQGKVRGRRSASPTDKAGDSDVSPPTLEHLDVEARPIVDEQKS